MLRSHFTPKKKEQTIIDLTALPNTPLSYIAFEIYSTYFYEKKYLHLAEGKVHDKTNPWRKKKLSMKICFIGI